MHTLTFPSKFPPEEQGVGSDNLGSHPHGLLSVEGSEGLIDGAYKQPTFIFHISGAENSKIKVPAHPVSGEELLPSRWHLLPVSSQAFSLVCRHGESPLVSFPLPLRASALCDEGPTITISFHLNYFLNGRIPKYSHIGGQSFNILILEGTQFSL